MEASGPNPPTPASGDRDLEEMILLHYAALGMWPRMLGTYLPDLAAEESRCSERNNVRGFAAAFWRRKKQKAQVGGKLGGSKSRPVPWLFRLF